MAKAKEIVGLDCDAPAGEGVRLVLTSRLDEMIAYRDEALDFSSDKGVHDMRVASRRLRSALRDFSPYVSRKRIARAKDELRRLARSLGAVRDEDVAIGLLEQLSEEAPEELRAGVESFAEKRRARREGARADLVREISAETVASLREEFVRALERAVRERAEDEEAGALKFREAGRAVVLARWEELEELSGSLYEPFDTERLHEMRIRGKRLRYAIELLTPCLGGDALKFFCEEIADMQTSLGELHDCDEWIAAIGAWLGKTSRRKLKEDVSTDDDAGGESTVERRRAAALWMLEHFTRLRNGHYREALARWGVWERDDFAPRLRAVLDENRSEAGRAAPEPPAPDVAISSETEPPDSSPQDNQAASLGSG